MREYEISHKMREFQREMCATRQHAGSWNPRECPPMMRDASASTYAHQPRASPVPALTRHQAS